MKKNTWFFIIATALLGLVVYDMTCWILITQQTESFEMAKSIYLDRYPSFLQNARYITFFEMILLVVSIILFNKIQFPKSLQIISKIGVVVAAILFAWLTFSLM